jgi:hypothetical protein
MKMKDPITLQVESDIVFEAYQQGFQSGAKVERESCARLCETLGEEFDELPPSDMADAIRRRGLAE